MSMRLFMTTDAVGGVWRYAMTLATRLAADGMTVRLGVVGEPPAPHQAAEVAGVAGLDFVHLDVPFDWLAGSAKALARGRAVIAAAAAAWRADIVQLNQPAYAGYGYSAPTVAVAHSCVATWWRGTHGADAPTEWNWHRQAVGRGLDAADAAVAPSTAFAETLAATYALEAVPRAIHNGIPENGRPLEKDRFVFAAGRAWDRSKNFAALDRAAPRIGWPVHLAGACTAPGGQEAEGFAHLRCLGHLDGGAMSRTIRRAPIFVAPSVYEPFGLGALEAAQAGAALVLSDIPTFRELWSGAALFFDARDADALAAQTNRLIAEPALRRRLAAAAADRSRDFTDAAMARRMTDLYGALTRREARPMEAVG